MTRSRKSTVRESKAARVYRQLTKVDAVLYNVREILEDMGFGEYAVHLDAARVDIAKRLESLQGHTFGQLDPSYPAPSRRLLH
jgi:hypothetical protein